MENNALSVQILQNISSLYHVNQIKSTYRKNKIIKLYIFHSRGRKKADKTIHLIGLYQAILHLYQIIANHHDASEFYLLLNAPDFL